MIYLLIFLCLALTYQVITLLDIHSMSEELLTAEQTNQVAERSGTEKDAEPFEYALTDNERGALENEYTYHAPTEDQRRRYLLIREAAKQLAETIMRNSPPSRERSVALTQLRLSNMSANAAIAINE